MPAPGYSAYIAPDKCAQLGRVIFGGPEAVENRHRLFQGVAELLDRLRMPGTMRAAGVAEDEFLQALARSAFGGPEQPYEPTDATGCRDHGSAQIGHYGSDDQID